MKTVFAAAVFTTAAMFGSTTASAQSTANATATGSVTIVQPLTITKDADMAFGRIVRPSTGTGTVSLANTSDAVSATAGAVALTGITTSRAKFTINGEGAQAVTLTVPASFDMLNGTDSLTVTLSPDLTSPVTLSGTLGAAGSASLNVGGSFSLPSTTPTGVYSGTFQVTVAYQ